MGNMPEAVKKQAKKAAKIQKDLAEEKPVKAKSAKGKEEPKPEDAEAKKAPEQAPAPAKETPPAEDVQQDWEQKYKVLKGKYDAEVTADIAEMQNRLASIDADNAQLREQLTEASNTIATLNELLTGAQQGASTAAQQAESKVLDPDDFEGYGQEMSDLIDLVNSQAKELAELRSSTQGIVQDQVRTAQDKFYDALDKRLHNWREINVDKRFLKWLEDPDPASGFKRMDLLQNHYGNLNAEGVLYFFNSWMQSAGIAAPQPQVKGEVQESTGALESMVMPDSSGGASVPDVAPTAQAGQITQAAKDFAKGKITQEEYTKIATAYQTALAKAGQKK